MTPADNRTIAAQLELLALTVPPETAALLDGFTASERIRLWQARRDHERRTPNGRNRRTGRCRPVPLLDGAVLLLALLVTCLVAPVAGWLADLTDELLP